MPVPKKQGYIYAFDGIRAIALIIILIFHYRPSGFELLPGGFIGVDIFFVLSGYLITMMLIVEWQKNGKISLKNFWLMRARRLLPAVFALILALAFLAATLPNLRCQLEQHGFEQISKYIPDLAGDLATIKNQAVPAAGYFINWHFIFEGKSYFELMDRPSLFGHLWSLSIEEQFYLLWPLVLILFFGLFGWKRTLLAALFAKIALASAISLYINGQAAPLDARAYFGTDSRAYALMIGAIAALYFKPHRAATAEFSNKSVAADLLGLTGFAILGYLCLSLSGGELAVFHSGLFLASAASIMIIIAGLSGHSLAIEPVLRNPLLGWLGQRSYGMYLWHWPVFILTEPRYNYPLDGWPLLLLRLVLLVSIVEFSFHYIENPIRYGGLGRFWHKLIASKGKEQMKLATRFCISLALLSALVNFCIAATVSAKPEISAVTRLAAAENPAEKPPDAAAAASVKNDSAAEAIATNAPEPPVKQAETESTANTETTAEAKITETPAPAKEKPTEEISVTAIGDSVMLGSRDNLIKEIGKVKVDAVVSRQFTEVERIVASLKQSGKITPYVFIHTGNNGTIDEKHFCQMMDSLSGCQRVVIFNVRVPRSWQDSNNAIFARVVPRYPNAILIDWQKESAGRIEFFYKDGIHLKSPLGTGFYASLARRALLGDS